MCGKPLKLTALSKRSRQVAKRLSQPAVTVKVSPSATGSVLTLDGDSTFTASGLDLFADGWFTAGKLTFTSGANAGLAMEVKIHRALGDGVHLTLWQTMARFIEVGDAFIVTAGCDKRFATCRDRFANTVNFRGFPQIPGNDFVIRYAVPGEPGNDGRSLAG